MSHRLEDPDETKETCGESTNNGLTSWACRKQKPPLQPRINPARSTKRPWLAKKTPIPNAANEITVSRPSSSTPVSPDARSRYRAEHGKAYDDAVGRIEANLGKPILSLFKLPLRGKSDADSNRELTDEQKKQADEKKLKTVSMKTELVFIERCLDLLAPGGRMGVVLPEGIFNNPSLSYAREFTEDRAFLRGVVSLSQDTFISSGASVKCSILFLEKFTVEEEKRFNAVRNKAIHDITKKHQPAIDTEHTRLETALAEAKEAKDRVKTAELRKELAAFDKKMADIIATDSRALLKQRFDYPVFLYEAEKVGISATGEPD